MLSVIGSRRVFTLQWRDNQLLTTVAVEVSKIHPVRRRILADRMQLPIAGRVLTAGDPVKGSTRFGRLGAPRLPGGSDRKIQVPVAVDVVWGEADVVLLGLPLQDHVLCPVRIFQP